MRDRIEALIQQSLLNCFIRENDAAVAHFEHRSELRLSRIETQLVFRPTRVLQTGDVILDDAVTLDGKTLSAQELMSLIVRQTEARDGFKYDQKPDWEENFQNSIEVLGQVLRKRESPSLAAMTFEESEQSLILGHRFHPSPKSRVGWTKEEVAEFSPEMNPRFRIPFVSVPESELHFFGSDALRAEWLSAKGRFRVPLHPWQLRRWNAVSHCPYEVEFSSDDWVPTSSVRTLYSRKRNLFLKTSLDIRITNCFRRNARHEIEAAVVLSELVSQISYLNTRSFHVLGERAGGIARNEQPVSTGFIIRDGFRDRESEPLLAASLWGDEEWGSARVAELSGFASRETVKESFRRYAELLMTRVFDAYFDFGLMFEPHLQNVLVEIESGSVSALILRDLDNVRVVKGSWADDQLIERGFEHRNEVIFPEEETWPRLVYCLFVNHFAETIATLSRLHSDERVFWGILCEEVEKYRASRAFYWEKSRLSSLLSETHLPAKANLFTRISRTPDKSAPFGKITNPMSGFRREA